jgi:hypothetical protein
LTLFAAAQLLPETLYLTTNLIDRFLELKGVSRKNLQLVCNALRGPQPWTAPCFHRVQNVKQHAPNSASAVLHVVQV